VFGVFNLSTHVLCDHIMTIGSSEVQLSRNMAECRSGTFLEASKKFQHF